MPSLRCLCVLFVLTAFSSVANGQDKDKDKDEEGGEVAKKCIDTPRLTEWLVRTILLVGCAIWNPRAGRDRKSIFTDADQEHRFVS